MPLDLNANALLSINLTSLFEQACYPILLDCYPDNLKSCLYCSWQPDNHFAYVSFILLKISGKESSQRGFD